MRSTSPQRVQPQGGGNQPPRFSVMEERRELVAFFSTRGWPNSDVAEALQYPKGKRRDVDRFIAGNSKNLQSRFDSLQTLRAQIEQSEAASRSVPRRTSGTAAPPSHRPVAGLTATGRHAALPAGAATPASCAAAVEARPAVTSVEPLANSVIAAAAAAGVAVVAVANAASGAGGAVGSPQGAAADATEAASVAAVERLTAHALTRQCILDDEQNLRDELRNAWQEVLKIAGNTYAHVAGSVGKDKRHKTRFNLSFPHNAAAACNQCGSFMRPSQRCASHVNEYGKNPHAEYALVHACSTCNHRANAAKSAGFTVSDSTPRHTIKVARGASGFALANPHAFVDAKRRIDAIIANAASLLVV